MLYMKKILGVLLICMVMIGMVLVLDAMGENSDKQLHKSVWRLDGEWNVSGTEEEMNAVIVLTGNLTILNGGKLTLKNVTLAMNSTYDGEHHITINPGGT